MPDMVKYRERCTGCMHFDGEIEHLDGPCKGYGEDGHYMVPVDIRGIQIPTRTRVPRVTAEDWKRLAEMRLTAEETKLELSEIRKRFGLDEPSGKQFRSMAEVDAAYFPDVTKGPDEIQKFADKHGLLPTAEASLRTMVAHLTRRRGTLAHVTEAISENDVTPEDRSLVDDFYKNAACHAEWCEFDEMMLTYIATRSRLNGRKAAFEGLLEWLRYGLQSTFSTDDVRDRMPEKVIRALIVEIEEKFAK